MPPVESKFDIFYALTVIPWVKVVMFGFMSWGVMHMHHDDCRVS